MIKKVLVTGGAGYVGSALVPRLLEKGCEVSVYDTYWYGEVFSDIKNSNLGGNLREIRADLRDEKKLYEACRDNDAVIHLACISNDPSFELDKRLGKSINFDAFLFLVETAKKHDIERFIYASSSSVYGIKKERDVTEEAKPEPLTDYSLFKFECERYLHENADELPYVIVRPATVSGYAPRLRLDVVVNILAINALERGIITVHGGKQMRSNINIRDMAAAYELLFEAPLKDIYAETFNVGNENYSVEEIARKIQSLISARIECKETNDPRSYYINSDKIRNKLGFIPKHTIEDSVESLIEAHSQGKIVDGLNNPIYHNIKRMKELGIS